MNVPHVDALEIELAEYIQENKYVVMLSAGTAAIHLGLVQLGVQEGDEVICQDTPLEQICITLKNRTL